MVLLLVLLALWRYMEQRFKATNQAYWSVITLTAKDGKVSFEKLAPQAGSPTHAGGVVFRLRGDEIQYLLVEAKNDPDQWVLPKGHVEELEDYRETAIREVREETGVWAGIGIINPSPPIATVGILEEARIAADLGNVSYSINGADVTVRFYLMQAVGRGLREDKTRQHLWLSLQQAIARASHPQTRVLLQAADERRSSKASVPS